MPTSMLQPAKVLGEVDEGTLLHELHTVGLADTDEEFAMDDDLLLRSRGRMRNGYHRGINRV